MRRFPTVGWDTHVRMSFGGRSYEAFDWFKLLKYYVVVASAPEEGGNVMGYIQHLDLAREHRSLVLIGLSSGVIYGLLYIPP